MSFEARLSQISRATSERFRLLRREAPTAQEAILATIHARADFHSDQIKNMFGLTRDRMLIGYIGTQLLDHFLHQDLTQRFIDNPGIDPAIDPQIGEFPSASEQLGKENAQRLTHILQASRLSQLSTSDQKRCYAPLVEIAQTLIDTYDTLMSTTNGKRARYKLPPENCDLLAREYSDWLTEYDLDELLTRKRPGTAPTSIFTSPMTVRGVSIAVVLASGLSVAAWLAARPHTEITSPSRPVDTRPAPTGTGFPDTAPVSLLPQQPHTATLIPDVYRYIHEQDIITSEKASFALSPNELVAIAKRLINEPISPGSPESLQDLMRHQGLVIELGDPFETPQQIISGPARLPMLQYPTKDAPPVAEILPHTATLYIAPATVKDQKTGNVVEQYGLGYTPFIQTAPKNSDKGIWQNAIPTDSAIYFIHPWYVQLPSQ